MFNKNLDNQIYKYFLSFGKSYKNIKYQAVTKFIKNNSHIKLYLDNIRQSMSYFSNETDISIIKAIFGIKSKELKISNFKCIGDNCNNILPLLKVLSGRVACSHSCAVKNEHARAKTRKTCQERYGVDYVTQSDNFKISRTETCKEKYGVDQPAQSAEIQNKMKQTCLKRYGVEYASQSDQAKQQFKETCLEKYGVTHHFKLKEEQLKAGKTVFTKHGVNHISTKIAWDNIQKLSYVTPMFSKDEFKGTEHLLYKWKCNFCGNIFLSRYDGGMPSKKCKCQIIRGTSKGEQELIDFCKQFYPNLIEHNRTLIKPYELDIVIPERKLAIEFNGIYWHSIEARNTF